MPTIIMHSVEFLGWLHEHACAYHLWPLSQFTEHSFITWCNGL